MTVGMEGCAVGVVIFQQFKNVRSRRSINCTSVDVLTEYSS